VAQGEGPGYKPQYWRKKKNLISASQVARITDMSHQHLVFLFLLLQYWSKSQMLWLQVWNSLNSFIGFVGGWGGGVWFWIWLWLVCFGFGGGSDSGV
jgi:hypothetical protein